MADILAILSTVRVFQFQYMAQSPTRRSHTQSTKSVKLPGTPATRALICANPMLEQYTTVWFGFVTRRV